MKNTTTQSDRTCKIEGINASTIRSFSTEARLVSSKSYQAWKNERHFIAQTRLGRFTAVFMTDAQTAISMAHAESGFFAIGMH
jgi:hypothetical protein